MMINREDLAQRKRNQNAEPEGDNREDAKTGSPNRMQSSLSGIYNLSFIINNFRLLRSFASSLLILPFQGRFSVFSVISVFSCSFFLIPARAEFPFPRLFTVWPPGGMHGSQVEIKLAGQELDGPQKLHFSHPEISAVSKEDKFVVSIGTNVPPGVYDLRLQGKHGLSNPRAFVVGALGELVEGKDYFKTNPPALTPGPATANGQLAANQVDTFRLPLTASQKLSIRIETQSIDSRLEPVLTLIHPSGREVARVQGRDQLDYSASDSVEYRLKVHDQTYRGGPEYFYRITARTGGTSTNEEKNFKPTWPFQAAVTVEPAPLADDSPNDWPLSARSLTLPAEVKGAFYPRNDRDFFRFEAQKDQPLWIEVISHRLGIATDPVAVLYQTKDGEPKEIQELGDSEANVGGPEFNTSHRDPSLHFVPKESGTYFLGLRDLINQGRRENIYTLKIRQPKPHFILVVVPVRTLPANKDAKDVPLATTNLRRGQNWPIKIVALRREGFDGPIDLEASDLPPGVSAIPARIEAGRHSTLLFLSAATNAPAGAHHFGVVGRSTIGSNQLIRTAQAASTIWQVADPANEPLITRLTPSMALAVIEENFPIQLTTSNSAHVATVSNKLSVPLNVDRKGEFTSAIKLKPVGSAAVESAKELEIDPKKPELIYEIEKLPVGEHLLVFQGLVQGKPAGADGKPGKEQTFTFYSHPLRLKIEPEKLRDR